LLKALYVSDRYCNGHVQVAPGMAAKKECKSKKGKMVPNKDDLPSPTSPSMDGRLKFSDRLKALLNSGTSSTGSVTTAGVASVKEESVDQPDDPYAFSEPEPQVLRLYQNPNPNHTYSRRCVALSSKTRQASASPKSGTVSGIKVVSSPTASGNDGNTGKLYPALSASLGQLFPSNSPSLDASTSPQLQQPKNIVVSGENKVSDDESSKTMNRLQAKIARNKVIGKHRKVRTSSQSPDLSPKATPLAATTKTSSSSRSLWPPQRERSLLEEQLLGLKPEVLVKKEAPSPTSLASRHGITYRPQMVNHSSQAVMASIPSKRRRSKVISRRNEVPRHEALQRIHLVQQTLRDYRQDLYPLGVEVSDSEESDGEESAVYQRHWFSAWLETDLACVDGQREREGRLGQMRAELRRRLNQTWRGMPLPSLGPPGKSPYSNALVEALLDSARRQPSQSALFLRSSQQGRGCHSQMRHNRSKVTMLVKRVCSYRKGEADACSSVALPCTQHCVRHIMYNVDQLLFEHCTAKFSDNTQCCVPVFDICHELPLCLEHARKRDNYDRMCAETKPKKVRKKAKPSAMTRPSKRGKKKRRVQRPPEPPPSGTTAAPLDVLADQEEPCEFESWKVMPGRGRGVELYSQIPKANAWIFNKSGLSTSEWVTCLKMNANLAAVRGVPGRSLDGSRCRHGCPETETLAHVQVEEEVFCLATNGSSRRIDIIAYSHTTKKGYIIDPTIRIETGSSQPEDVNQEKINIYLPTVDYFKAKDQLEDIEVIGLLIGARGVIPKFFESFRKTFELPQTLTADIITSVLKRSCQILKMSVGPSSPAESVEPYPKEEVAERLITDQDMQQDSVKDEHQSMDHHQQQQVEVEVEEEVLAMAEELPLDTAELANHASRLLEEHDLTNVLNQIPADAFNDLFTGQIDKSAVAAHAYQEGDHNIRFKDTDILSTTTHFFPRLHREAIEIHKHNNNFNRKEEGVKLNKCWYPVLNRTDKKPLQQKDGTQNGSSEQSGADRSVNRPRPASRTINTPAQPDTGSNLQTAKLAITVSCLDFSSIASLLRIRSLYFCPSSPPYVVANQLRPFSAYPLEISSAPSLGRRNPKQTQDQLPQVRREESCDLGYHSTEDVCRKDKNGEYEPTREETEELERALEAVDKDVKSLEKLSQTQGLLVDTLMDEHALVQTLAQLPADVPSVVPTVPGIVPVFATYHHHNGYVVNMPHAAAGMAPITHPMLEAQGISIQTQTDMPS
ncbi:hypothetical protein ANN_00047, partial [Periplaneta americana]